MQKNARLFLIGGCIGLPEFITTLRTPHKSASNNTTTIMECDSCWVPDGQHGPDYDKIMRSASIYNKLC